MTNQNRRLEFNVSKTEEEMLGSISSYLVREILEQYQKNRPKMNIVVPAGKTADKFYEKFTEEISNTGANLERVHFYVGEDFYPLRKDHPMSFSGSLKSFLKLPELYALRVIPVLR